jgi:asparagine synthase (glutamine-hydrolysing)
VAAGFGRWHDDVCTQITSEAALLAWDEQSRRGFVARDRLGASSVFWSRQDGVLAFATEVRILLALLRRRPAPDPVGVIHWLRREGSRPDLTLYEGVLQLEVGTRLRLDTTSIERYWRPTFAPREGLTMDDAVELVRPALRRAVGRRLAPAGETGVLLSGGLDSTSAVGAARALEADLRAYSLVFPDRPRIDESPWIDDVAAATGYPVVRLTPESRGAVTTTTEFIRRWDAPPAGWDVWADLVYARVVADGIGVLLTGEVAEALFDTRLALIGDRLRAGRVLEASRLARRAPLGFYNPSPGALRRILWHAALPGLLPTAGPRLMAAREGRRQPEWLRQDVLRSLRETAGPSPEQALGGPAWWNGPAHDLTTMLPSLGLLQYERRRGEAVGVAIRTPYVDVELASLALSLPPELSFNGLLTKPVLRAVAGDRIPDSVRLRPYKTRWDSLIVEIVTGEDWPAIRALLADPTAEISRYVVHERFVEDMLRPRSGGNAWPWAPDLLRFAAIELWLRREAGRDM